MPSLRDAVVDGLFRDGLIGLDYVYLDGGYEISESEYGEGVSVADDFGLHRAVAGTILRSSLPLRGQELKFLRTLMEMDRHALAGMIGVPARRIEALESTPSSALPPDVDGALRAAASGHLGLAGVAAACRDMPVGTERALVANWDADVRRWSAEVGALAPGRCR